MAQLIQEIKKNEEAVVLKMKADKDYFTLVP